MGNIFSSNWICYYCIISIWNNPTKGIRMKLCAFCVRMSWFFGSLRTVCGRCGERGRSPSKLKSFSLTLSIYCLLTLIVGSDSTARAEAPPELSADYTANLKLKVPGLKLQKVSVDGKERSYQLHVPLRLDVKKPVPILLAYHGAMTNGMIMAVLTGLNEKADASNFVVVYPNGTGGNDINLFFNSFQNLPEAKGIDDVAFTSKILDDLGKTINIDARRVFATGISNGGMMCYKLASELSDRIAAIAPVAGTMAIRDAKPTRGIPIIHFHGTGDRVVRYDGQNNKAFEFAGIKGVEDTLNIWSQANEIRPTLSTTELPVKVADGTSVSKIEYGQGKDQSEIVLYKIENGGHCWPGRPMPLKQMGTATGNISANDLMWDFFMKHPKKD